MTGNDRIYGERVTDLLPALMRIKDGMTPDRGGYRIEARFDEAEADPLRRAMLRAEAEIECEEATRIGTVDEADDDAERRTADALVRVVTAIASAP